MEQQKPPRTTKELLAAILEVLVCLDSAVHRLEEQLAEDDQVNSSPIDG